MKTRKAPGFRGSLIAILHPKKSRKKVYRISYFRSHYKSGNNKDAFQILTFSKNNL